MTASLIRIAVLVALAFAGIFGCLCSVCPEAPMWPLLLLLSKFAGFAALFAMASMYRRWRQSDRIIKAVDRWLASADEDRPNPLKL